MIRLTSAQSGETVYIAPENVTFITKTRMPLGDLDKPRELVTAITTSDTMLYVTESPAEVARKVLEWKYIMQNGAYTKTKEMARLRELAGLEERA